LVVAALILLALFGASATVFDYRFRILFAVAITLLAATKW
jgi:hypothetical protein